MILPVFFIHIGHLGVCVEKQSDFFPQDQFHASNPCQTWHKQGWNPGPAKVNSNAPMGVSPDHTVSFLHKNQPSHACLSVGMSVERDIPSSWRRKSWKASKTRPAWILNMMLELLKMVFLSLWKVCYTRSWQVQSSPRYPHHPENDIRNYKKQFVHFLPLPFLQWTSVCSETHTDRGEAI